MAPGSARSVPAPTSSEFENCARTQKSARVPSRARRHAAAGSHFTRPAGTGTLLLRFV